MSSSSTVLEVKELRKYFPIKYSFFDRTRKREKTWVRAVDNVSFTLEKNETLGIVGESGCGKTTLGRSVLMLHAPTSGEVYFKNEEISKARGEKLRRLRKNMQIVFQNPYSSLNPRHRVRDLLLEPMRAFGSIGEEEEALAKKSLSVVGLPEDSYDRLPHQFSGGQRQRIAIARALMMNPQLIVLDEPTSALDSSVQTQILNLLRSIQEKYGLSYLFITHNISVVKYVSDRVAVMYAGKIVELGPTREVLENPMHPYTVALKESVPLIGSGYRKHELLPGEAPSPVAHPSGCRFSPRCKYAQEVCKNDEPELREISKGHWAACHFSEDIFLSRNRHHQGSF